ncbi:hypothetical protein JMN32_07550 [Fulvivirga sp. 29W222]|uniref:Uncharacterized protein n=1 Tax=Fulvivirga marina TaxID=2494733 RepID=A0A937FWU7_9BACT|nr:hypothetical protein [Fulvivirga marina]MBL6446157.1 hypothetical protein [Fulvivirga marina]
MSDKQKKLKEKEEAKKKEQKDVEETELDEEEEYRGILPNRDLKKNLGCGG